MKKGDKTEVYYRIQTTRTHICRCASVTILFIRLKAYPITGTAASLFLSLAVCFCAITSS